MLLKYKKKYISFCAICYNITHGNYIYIIICKKKRKQRKNKNKTKNHILKSPFLPFNIFFSLWEDDIRIRVCSKMRGMQGRNFMSSCKRKMHLWMCGWLIWRHVSERFKYSNASNGKQKLNAETAHIEYWINSIFFRLLHVKEYL